MEQSSRKCSSPLVISDQFRLGHLWVRLLVVACVYNEVFGLHSGFIKVPRYPSLKLRLLKAEVQMEQEQVRLRAVGTSIFNPAATLHPQPHA
jgi:hypothetical protein